MENFDQTCKLSIFILLALCWVSVGNINGQKSVVMLPAQRPTRYVIFYDKLSPKSSQESVDYRNVAILIDSKNFSKERLVEVFALLTKRYPEPQILSVQVFTSLDDVDTPEEDEKGKVSGSDAPKWKGDSAYFVRNGAKKQFFYMNFANGKFLEVNLN